jgi:hypothetical protein
MSGHTENTAGFGCNIDFADIDSGYSYRRVIDRIKFLPSSSIAS